MFVYCQAPNKTKVQGKGKIKWWNLKERNVNFLQLIEAHWMCEEDAKLIWTKIGNCITSAVCHSRKK